MGETRLRTATKAIGWQLLGLLVSFLLGWFFTGSITQSGGLSLSLAAIGFTTYVFYERLWLAIPWGRIHLDDAQSAANSSRR